MKPVRGGRFAMGSDDFYEDERPVRVVEVEDFLIDETPVTNEEFARFVADSAYVTVSEVAPDPLDYPGMDPAMACAGSATFMPPIGPVDLRGGPLWWSFVFGANWRWPLGPGGPPARPEHPVVHVAYADALAYAEWAGKRLPSEAEWEYAARGGLDGARYAWGDELEPGGRTMAKIWCGEFPWRNDAPPGLERTAPVRSYPPNAFGLYDMIGNVWEWTQDLYCSSPARKPAPSCCGATRALGGVERSTAQTASAEIPLKVIKGGSHLCAPSYCRRYRPAARWPQPLDTSTSHLGFRCVVDGHG